MKIETNINFEDFKTFDKETDDINKRFGISSEKFHMKILYETSIKQDISLNTNEIALLINLWLNTFPEKSNAFIQFVEIRDQIEKKCSLKEDPETGEKNYNFIDVIQCIMENERFNFFFPLIFWEMILVPVEIQYRLDTKNCEPDVIINIVQKQLNEE